MIPVCKNDECPKFKDPRSPLLLIAELDIAWSYQCRTCGTMQVKTKDRMGGTLGSGLRGDGVRTNQIGWTPGSERR